MATFGSAFAGTMALARFENGAWSAAELQPVAPLALHPGAHCLHYASTCFEGLKAYRHHDGGVHVFRLDRHVARLQNSAALLCLPAPDPALVEEAILSLVRACRDDVPAYPGALYLRPILLGTEPSIGGASTPSSDATLCVLASPVGDYFAGGERPLRILIDDAHMRATADFGAAKTGGNYAAALRHVIAAKQQHGTDQVLFCPGGSVQETGAANFILIDDARLVTPRADGAILHGVTRDSLLALAGDMGYGVEERALTVAEVLAWARQGEAALSGTAAVLAGIGTFIYRGETHAVNAGHIGDNTRRLREALMALHRGASADERGWLTAV